MTHFLYMRDLCHFNKLIYFLLITLLAVNNLRPVGGIAGFEFDGTVAVAVKVGNSVGVNSVV